MILLWHRTLSFYPASPSYWLDSTATASGAAPPAWVHFTSQGNADSAPSRSAVKNSCSRTAMTLLSWRIRPRWGALSPGSMCGEWCTVRLFTPGQPAPVSPKFCPHLCYICSWLLCPWHVITSSPDSGIKKKNERNQEFSSTKLRACPECLWAYGNIWAYTTCCDTFKDLLSRGLSLSTVHTVHSTPGGDPTAN